MNLYRADLHIHTVLSPCGKLEMSPLNIIKEAKKMQLDIIGITDHNSTKNCVVTKMLGEKNNIFVLMGAEVTTKEEIHCLVFFKDEFQLSEFQKVLEIHQSEIKNDVDKFDYQLVVDENENIIEQEEILLITATDLSFNQLEVIVHEMGGLFIPAHINRTTYSILSQLGFIPTDINVDAFEISKHISLNAMQTLQPQLKDASFITNSDAHFLKDIASAITTFKMNNISFEEIKMALCNINNRKVIIE